MAKRRPRPRNRTALEPSTQRNKPAVRRNVSRTSAQARRRRAVRRRRHMILFRVFCCVLVCVVAIFATTVFFRVSRIDVTGDTRYDIQQLIATSGVGEGDNMFFLDSDHIAQTLNQTYPYLNEVRVHKKMPSTVEIEVSDRTPVVSVPSSNEYLLIDSAGKVLDSVNVPQAETAVIAGVTADGLNVGDTIGEDREKLRTALDLMALMMTYEMNTDVNEIDLSKAYDVQMQYANQYTILLGNMDDLEHKIQFLQAILKEPSLPESGIIDLTDDKEARYRPEDTTVSSTQDTDSEQPADSEAGQNSTGVNAGTDDSQNSTISTENQTTSTSQDTSVSGAGYNTNATSASSEARR